MNDTEQPFRLCAPCLRYGSRSCLGCDRQPLNEYNAQCAYCIATNPINAERCCACARLNWRRP